MPFPDTPEHFYSWSTLLRTDVEVPPETDIRSEAQQAKVRARSTGRAFGSMKRGGETKQEEVPLWPYAADGTFHRKNTVDIAHLRARYGAFRYFRVNVFVPYSPIVAAMWRENST